MSVSVLSSFESSLSFVSVVSVVVFSVSEDYELVVGDGEMIDGFEDGIVGMKSGETKELDLTFPDDYYEESVAGKAVVFKVTLQKFTRPAELTDEWVAANTDYKTVDE